MEASTTGRKGDAKSKRNAYRIGGISVDFPHKAYGSQLAFMGRVISTLDRAQKQGHCHALLESPTGTGKTLSLLCSTLSWQKNYSPRYSKPSPSSPIGNATKGSDPFVDGGGFIPESESQRPTVQHGNSGEKRERAPPRIYYTSRTHTQITQVINEYRKTSYRVPMAVLASRKHYCTNPVICKSDEVNENCKKLLKDEKMGCAEFKNANRVKDHPSIKRGGSHEVHDIEDLAKIGRSVKGCSYFGARSLAVDAHLVFCPYNYVINPIIRKAMEVDLKGSILILDEAHNIEDMAREAGSIDIDEDTLHRLQHELGELCYGHSGNSSTYQPLHDMVQGMISWIGRRTDDLGYHDFEHYSSCWTGDGALRELADSGICPQSFLVLEGCAKKAIKDYSEGVSEQGCLSGMSATILEGLFCSLYYIFVEGCHYAIDYQLVLQRLGKTKGNKAKIWAHTLSLWCMNPGIFFREMANLSLSVILTSGTLSPMGSFSSELGVEFDVCMEAPHVIDAESQLYANVLSKGPQNYCLNASFKTSEGYTFQDELGSSLEEIFKAVPGGILVFFPSYKFLEKLHIRWQQTGRWSQLNAVKHLFVEPRGNTGDFDRTLKAYFKSVRVSKTNGPRKMNEMQKRQMKRFPGIQPKNSTERQGGALLAVCRGKVSEGVNFSDDDARAVVIVGIPFPNINDLQVALKKKYNDTFRSTKNLLGGNVWYCHQAFRALNQAAGRCIRHRSDYGAVIFLDERFKEERNRAYISKWIGTSLKQSESFQLVLEELVSFFQNAKESKPPEKIKVESQNLLKYGNVAPNSRQKKKLTQDTEHDKRLTASPSPLFLSEENDDHLRILSEDYISRDVLEPSFASYSASMPEEIPLEAPCFAIDSEVEQLNTPGHNPELEQESLGINSKCHKRKNQLNFSSNSVDDDDRAVRPSFQDPVDKSQELKPNETLQTEEDEDGVKILTESTEVKVQKLHLSCCACWNSLGLTESRFLVPCLVMASSNPCLSLFLENALSRMELVSVVVVVVDMWNVDRRVLSGQTFGDSQRRDVWSDEGGCVFRPVGCPFCSAIPANCLGLQILSTDASTAHLLNKVLFFRERLHVKEDVVSSENEEPMEIDRRSFLGQSKSPPSQTRSKSRLRLPRKGRD
ncbi:RAD3-like DNA-binding helicase protein [Wolffia australiana]